MNNCLNVIFSMVEQSIIAKEMVGYWRYSGKQAVNVTFLESDSIEQLLLSPSVPYLLDGRHVTHPKQHNWVKFTTDQILSMPAKHVDTLRILALANGRVPFIKWIPFCVNVTARIRDCARLCV